MFETSDSIEEPPIYKPGDIVWVKLSNYWWPGEVKSEEDLSKDIISDFKKPPKVIVKFFDEDSYEYINKWSNIYPYNCQRKSDFIKKGMGKYRAGQTHMAKFPKDIGTAEEKTNGDPNILSQSEFLPTKKIDLDEIFGTPKPTPKKAQKEIHQPTISHRRFLGNDDYQAIIMYQYPGKDRQPDSDSEDIQKQYDGPQADVDCTTCPFQTKRLGVFEYHCKTHMDGSFAAAKRKSKISEYDFIESDSEATTSKPKPKQRKKPVKKQTKQQPVDNWLDEWNDSDEEEMAVKEGLNNDKESLNDQAKEKGNAESIKETSGKVGNQAANNHTVVSKNSFDNTKDDIKNCFDFDDEEEEVDFGLSSPEGRKIPRVIPEKPRTSMTELLEPSKEVELDQEKNLLPTEITEKPEQSSETDPDLNRKEILRVSQSFNRGLDIDDSTANTFKEIMEITEVPALDDLGQTLKPEQNFHDARAVKFPDKGGTGTGKGTSSPSSKSGTSKKMVVTSFNDFEIGFRKMEGEESRKQDPAENQLERQELQESSTTNSKTKEILDAEMEEINKVIDTEQNLASEGITNHQEISLEQLTRDLEGSSDNEQNGDKTRQKNNESPEELEKNPPRNKIGRFVKILKETKSKKNDRDESQSMIDVKPQEDGNVTDSKPVQLEKQGIIELNQVDNQTGGLNTVTPKQEVAIKSSHKESSRQSLRRGRSNKSIENQAIEVPPLDSHEIPNKEIIHESKKSQSKKIELLSDPEKSLKDAASDAVKMEENLVKATNDIVEDIVDISLKRRSHYRIGKYRSEVPVIEKMTPSRRLTKHKSELPISDTKFDDLLNESVPSKAFLESGSAAKKSKSLKEPKIEKVSQIKEEMKEKKDATGEATRDTRRRHAKSYRDKMPSNSHKNKSEKSAIIEVSKKEEKRDKPQKCAHVEKEVALGSAIKTENIDAKSETIQSTESGNLISEVIQSTKIEPVSNQKSSRRKHHKSQVDSDKTPSSMEVTPVIFTDAKPAEILSEASLIEPEISFPTTVGANTEISDLEVVNVPIENQQLEHYFEDQLVYTSTESISGAKIETVAHVDVNQIKGERQDKKETIDKTNIEKTIEGLNFLGHSPAVPAKNPPHVTADMDGTEDDKAEPSNFIKTEEKSILLSPKTSGIVIDKLYGQKPKEGRRGRLRTRWDVVSVPQEPVADTNEDKLKELPVSTEIELPAVIQENTVGTLEINEQTANVPSEENAASTSDITILDYQNIVSFETVVTEPPQEIVEEKFESIIAPELLADIPLPPEPSPIKRVEEAPVKSHKKHKSRRSHRRESTSEKNKSNYIEDSVSQLALESIPSPPQDNKCLVSELIDKSLSAAQDAIVPDFNTESVVVSSNCQSDAKSEQEIILEKATLNNALTDPTEENVFVAKLVEQPVIEISAEKQPESIVENPNNDVLPSGAGFVSEAQVVSDVLEGQKGPTEAHRDIEKETVGTDVKSSKQELMQDSALQAEENIENDESPTYAECIEQIIQAAAVSAFNNQVEEFQAQTNDFGEAQQSIANKLIETAGESTKPENMQVIGTELLNSFTQTVQYSSVDLLEAQQGMDTEKIERELIIQATTEVTASEFVGVPQNNKEDFVEGLQKKENKETESDIDSIKQAAVEVTKVEEGGTEAEQSIDQEIIQATKPEFSESNTLTLEDLQLHGEGEHKIESETIKTSGKSIEQEIVPATTEPEVIEPNTQILEKVQLQGEYVTEAQKQTEEENVATSVETTLTESEGSEFDTKTQKICQLQEDSEIAKVQAKEPENSSLGKLQVQGEGAIEVQQKIKEEKIETSKKQPEVVEQQSSTFKNETLEVPQNIEKQKFETLVKSIKQETMKTTVPAVSETRMQTVEQVISDTVEQLFQCKEESVPKEWSSRAKRDKSGETVEDKQLMHNIDNLEIKGSSSLATLAAASVILENRERNRSLPKKYLQSEDIPLSEPTQDVSKITEEKLKSVPPKKKWPRRSSRAKKDSDIEETSEKSKSDPFEFTVSVKTEQPSQETTALDNELILPPKKAKRTNEASLLHSSLSEDRISPENKSDVDMSFPIFDDSFMSTSLRNNIEGIINTFDTTASTSSEPHSADIAKCVPPKKKKVEDSIEKVGENLPQSPKKKMQKLFENSQVVEKSTTELPLMSPLAKKKSFLFQQEELLEQSKIEPKTKVEETSVDESSNVSAKRKKRKSSSNETCTIKKEKKDETDFSAVRVKSECPMELGSKLPGTATSIKAIKTEDKSENALNSSAAGIDIKEEIIVPPLNEAELVPISVPPTVMTETDLADTQVEITTTEVISKKAPPTVSLESTIKNIISGKKIGGSSRKKIGETSGTKFTSKAMLKEFDPPYRQQVPKRKSDLLDILEGNSNSSTNSSGSEQKFKTSFDNYDTTNTVVGNIDFEDDIPRSEILLTSKGPDNVIMDSPRLLERLSMASGSKQQNQKVMVQSDIKVHKKLVMPKLVKPTDVPRAGQKILIKTAKPGGAPIPKMTGNKPIILSEQILRPATATTPTAIQPQGIKRQYEDIEDVETAFIIPKISKKEPIEEIAIAPKLHEKSAQARGSKGTAKSKIKQQTIVTTKPKGEVATATAGTSKQLQQKTQSIQDDSMFDISNMPVVLSEDLTAESIQNMPVILSEDILPQTSSMPVAASATQHQDKILAALSKKLVPGGGKQIIFRTTQPAGKTVTKSKLLQNPSSTLQSRIPKTGTPALFATCTTPDGKQAKYVLVPPAGTVPASRIQTGQKTVIKRQTPVQQKNVASGSGVAPAQDQLGGNKIMIVTNSQGQQTRTMLTPQQQIAWMQNQGKRTIIKGAIAKALLDSGTRPGSSADSTPSGTVVATTTMGATPIVSSQANLLMPVKAAPTTKKGTTKTTKPRTVLIKNQMGETVRRIQGLDNADLDRQVAEQLEAIKAMAKQQARKSQETASNLNRPIPSSMPSTSGKQVARRFTKKVEQKLKVPASTAAQVETQKSPEVVPALAPLSPQTRVSAAATKPSPTRKIETPATKAPEVRQETTVPTTTDTTEAEQESTLSESKQVVLRDAAGNLSTVTVGQILALPNDLVYGQPQTYVLVKVDENGTLQPLNNDALLSLDPSLSLGPEINNVVLNVDHDQGTVSASKPPDVIDSQQNAVQEEVQSVTNQELVPVTQEMQYSEQLQTVNEEGIVPADQLGQQETSIAVEQQILIGEGVLPGDAGGQQLMITGDQIATQKFIESLSNGSIDLGSILANAESGSVIVQTDGQQLLIRTNTLPQQAMLGSAESTEGDGNPMFATHRPNQDILAAALADTDVFQPALEPPLKSRGPVSPPGGSSSPGGGPGLYPMNANNVLETSLTLNVPIMSPLELPSNNNKKIDDEAEILHTVPKNVDLPITITDPNIVQTVAHQQAVGLLELSLPISEVGPITGMNSPSFSYSLPALDDSAGIQKSFSSSMPLLTEDAVESGNSGSLDQMIVSKDLDVVSTSFNNSDFGAMPRLSEAIESTREEVVETTSYNEFIGSMLNMSEEDVVDDSESSESRKSRRSKKRSILEQDQGLAIFGGKMCSSLSEPPPDMFDFDALTAPQREEEISSDVSSVPEPETLSLNSENSGDIPLQPPIVASLSDLKGPDDDDSASSGSDDKHA